MNITHTLLSLLLASTCIFSGCDQNKEDHSANTSDLEPAASIEPVAQQTEAFTNSVDETNSMPVEEPHSEFIQQLIATEGLDPLEYRVFAEAEGDLDENGLIDKVIAIQNKIDKTEVIITLVYLQQDDSTFQKTSTSSVVIPPEMNSDDNPLFDSISLTIDKSELVITVSKFTGNTQSHFWFIDGELRLTKIEQYATGAGEHYSSSIDLLNSTLEETRTNTLDENMPSETTTQSFHLPMIMFEKADPDIIIEQAIKGHQKQTITGVLLSGGGIDDLSITIQTEDGKKVQAYCDQHCGDWFVDDEEGNTGGSLLNRAFEGKSVSAVIATEISLGRIAGPGDDK